MNRTTNITQKQIANLTIACRYWELARKYNNNSLSKDYYAKAYAIISKEMGASHSIALELYNELNNIAICKQRRRN